MFSVSLTSWLRSWFGIFALCLAAALSACGGGGGGSSSGDGSGGGGGGGGGGNNPPPIEPAKTLSLSAHVVQSAGGDNRYGNAAGVAVKVTDADGTRDAGSTNANGDLPAVQVRSGDVVAQLSKAGYVDQVVRLTLDEHDANFNATLLPVAVTKTFNAQTGGTLTGPDGAKVEIEANSFVKSNGSPVTGTITVQITPYNAAANPNGFPGNPMLSNGIMVSMGMVDFSFFDAEGNKLQLAPTKTATITVPLYGTVPPDSATGIDALRVGDKVPTWSMDSATGIWKEEAKDGGTVVAEAASPTGLAMRAVVSHFTWWNCDYLRQIRQMTLKVYDANGALYNGSAMLQAIFSSDSLPGLGQYSTTGYTQVNLVNGTAKVDVPQDPVNGDFKLTVGELESYAYVLKNEWVAKTVVELHLAQHQARVITLSPHAATLDFNTDSEIAAGKSLQFFITTQNVDNTQIKWLVNNVEGGNSTVGTISAGGLYQSPSGTALNSLLGTIVTITAQVGSGLQATADTAQIGLRKSPLIIVGQTHGGGQLNVGGYQDWDTNASPILSYAIHNMSTDKFKAYLGNAAQPLSNVTWKLTCGIPAGGYYATLKAGGDCQPSGNPSFVVPVQVDANGSLNVQDVLPQSGNGLLINDFYWQPYYGIPLVWLTATSSSGNSTFSGTLRLVLAPVEDPIGDRVYIDVPSVDASTAGGGGIAVSNAAALISDAAVATVVRQLPTDGQVTVKREPPAAAVTSTITWKIVCRKTGATTAAEADCGSGSNVGPLKISSTGNLTGTSGLTTTSEYYYIQADWVTNSKPNHLVQQIWPVFTQYQPAPAT